MLVHRSQYDATLQFIGQFHLLVLSWSSNHRQYRYIEMRLYRNEIIFEPSFHSLALSLSLKINVVGFQHVRTKWNFKKKRLTNRKQTVQVLRRTAFWISIFGWSSSNTIPYLIWWWSNTESLNVLWPLSNLIFNFNSFSQRIKTTRTFSNHLHFISS